MKGVIYHILILLFSLTLCELHAQNPVAKSEQSVSVEFVVPESFDLFRTAAEEYALRTDSLFMQMDLPEWRQCYTRRLAKQQESYGKIQSTIDLLHQQLADRAAIERAQLSDTIRYSTLMDDDNLVNENLRLYLVKQCITLFYFRRANHFNDTPLLHQFLLEVLPDLERYMPRSEVTFSVYSSLVQMYSNLLHMENPEHARKCVYYAQKALSFEPQFDSFSDDDLRLQLVMDYYNLMSAPLLKADAFSVQNGEECLSQAIKMYESHPDFFNNPKRQGFKNMIEGRIHTYRTNVILSYIIPNSWDFHDPKYDQLIEANNAIMERDSSFLDPSVFYNYQVLKTYMGQKSFYDAWKDADAFYHAHPFDFANMQVLDVVSVATAIQSLAVLCDGAEMDAEEKHREMKGYADVLVKTIQSYVHYQMNDVMSPLVFRFMTNNRIRKYLTHEERIDYFYSLLPYIHIPSLCTQNLTKQLCTTLMNAIIDYQPELLVGTMGLKSKQAVAKKKNRKELNDFIALATDIYELGNCPIASVLNARYRPMTIPEYDLMISHPERSILTLLLEPSLRPYRDVILGVHKWNNGLRGYPAWFDNRLSEQRLFIDILAMCNYFANPMENDGIANLAGEHDFDIVFQTVASKSGSRFSKDLVQLIQTHKDVYDALKKIVNDDWAPVYYDVYSRYFNHAAETE